MTDYKIPLEIDGIKYFTTRERFELETGSILDGLTIAYHSYGKMNANKDNIIWVCHALTANSDPMEWWSGLFGKNRMFDPEKYFIVCANIIGSCYGTTGPRSIDSAHSSAYGLDFPLVTVRDWAKAHALLAKHLNIDKIQVAIGGSCGGHQVLEMCLLDSLTIENAVMIVSSARESSWSIAIHEAQRMALKSNSDFYTNEDIAGFRSLETARAIGMINYRTYQQYCNTQSDIDDRLVSHKAASYINYQAKKLRNRFYSHSYYVLLNSLDTHNIGRNRGGVAAALSKIEAHTLIISIDSDLLIPISEQEILQQYIPRSVHRIISSDFGHDGFLIETEKIENVLKEYFKIAT